MILLIGLEMLGLTAGSGGGSVVEPEAHPVAVGIFPMAVALFAGPGDISVVMVYAQRIFRSNHDLIVSMLVAAVAPAIIVGPALAATASRMIGPVTQRVLNRLLA